MGYAALGALGAQNLKQRYKHDRVSTQSWRNRDRNMPLFSISFFLCLGDIFILAMEQWQGAVLELNGVVRRLKIAGLKVIGGMHENKRLLQIALHGKNRRIRKKNEDRLLRWLAGYEVGEGAGNNG